MLDFSTDSACRAAVEEWRWPHGVTCLKCGSHRISRIATRRQYDCNACRHRFSATTGTIFHDSHLPLSKWFKAILLMCEGNESLSANRMKRELGVAYKTAWYLCHRIRQAMASGTSFNEPNKQREQRPFNRAIGASFHHVSHKHLDRYRGEFEFRFDYATNPHLFRDIVIRLLTIKPMPYSILISNEESLHRLDRA